MKNLIHIVLFSFISFATSAQANIWVINDDHSQVTFTVSYLGQGEITGRFNGLKGSVTIDDKLGPQDIAISIDARSIDTGNKMRDNHLRSSDFLRANAHPAIVFKSHNVVKVHEKAFMAKGELSIGGVIKPSEIEFQLSPTSKDTWGGESQFAKFKTEINRNDFNITWNKTLPDSKYLVGDVILIAGNVQLQPSGKLTATNKHMIPDTEYIRGREKLSRGEIHKDQIQGVPEFNKESKIVTPSLNQQTSASDNIVTANPLESRSYAWWFAFSYLGLLGFVASVVMGFYVKNSINEFFKGKYDEVGLIGHLSDFLIVIFVFIYSIALWEVGWG